MCFLVLGGSATQFQAVGHIALPGYVPVLMDFPTVVGADWREVEPWDDFPLQHRRDV